MSVVSGEGLPFPNEGHKIQIQKKNPAHTIEIIIAQVIIL